MLFLAVVAAPLFTVDLQAAVADTDAGRTAKDQLETAVARANDEATARRDRLLAQQPDLEPDAFEASRQALNRRVEASEARLAAREQALLAPILARFDALIREVEAATGGRVIDVAPRRVAGQPAACDLTEALARRFERGRVAVGQAQRTRCTPTAVARVDAAEAIAGTPAARRIVAARDADRERLGAALAALRDAGGDLERARRLRAQIAARDEAAQDALERAVHGAMVTLAGRHPNTVWLAADAAVAAGLPNVCSGTPYVRRELGGGMTEPGCRLGPGGAEDRLERRR